MPGLQDGLITARERVLNALLGIGRDDVLNGTLAEVSETSASVLLAPMLAGELASSMNALKAAGIDPTGRRVDYAALRTSDAYREYRAICAAQLRAFDPVTLATPAERLAFWINLYNALTIDAVIAFGVQSSVTEGRLGIVRFFRRAAYSVGGQRVSLDDMEHGILRANRGHPLVPGP